MRAYHNGVNSSIPNPRSRTWHYGTSHYINPVFFFFFFFKHLISTRSQEKGPSLHGLHLASLYFIRSETAPNNRWMVAGSFSRTLGDRKGLDVRQFHRANLYVLEKEGVRPSPTLLLTTMDTEWRRRRYRSFKSRFGKAVRRVDLHAYSLRGSLHMQKRVVPLQRKDSSAGKKRGATGLYLLWWAFL